MKIAIIGGTGGQGLGIAIRFVQIGEDVIIGSRTMEKAQAAVDKIKELLEKRKYQTLKQQKTLMLQKKPMYWF